MSAEKFMPRLGLFKEKGSREPDILPKVDFFNWFDRLEVDDFGHRWFVISEEEHEALLRQERIKARAEAFEEAAEAVESTTGYYGAEAGTCDRLAAEERSKVGGYVNV